MIFPKNIRDLNTRVMEVLAQCTSSRGRRDTFYKRCEDYYNHGGTDAGSGPINKIKPIVDRQSSFLYAPESTKFWVNPPADEASEIVYNQADAVSSGIALAWSDTGVDDKLSTAVTWSRIYGSYIVSILPRIRANGKVTLKAYIIDPRDFGVYREDVPDLDDQQAFSLTSYFSKEEIEHRLSGHPQKDELMFKLDAAGQQQGGSDEEVIIMGQDASAYQAQYYQRNYSPYRPETPAVMYAFHDLYAYDDLLGDYRVFTVTGSSIVWDRPISRIGIPGIPPFVKICPEPNPKFFWGNSLVDDLQRLQDWYSDRTADMDELIQQILHPPTAGIGLGQSFEEKMDAFRRPGGKIALQNNQATIQQFVPQMPNQVFEFVGGIDAALTHASGMNSGMLGNPDQTSDRTEGMAAQTMRLAATQMRLMGLRVERQVQKVAKLLFNYLRLYSPFKLIDEQGNLFLMADFPADSEVRVDGHSTSPLFVEDNAQMAMGLMRYGAITQETLIRLLHPALEGKMIKDLSKIQFAKLVAAEKLKLEQDQKRSGKSSTDGS